MGWHSLTEVVFEPTKGRRQLCGFHLCRALLKVAVPASIEVIDQYAFHQCDSQGEVTFVRDSRLRILKNLIGLSSLPRISIAESVELSDRQPFRGCESLAEEILQGAPDLDRFAALRSCLRLRRIELQCAPADLNRNSRLCTAFKSQILCKGRTTEWSALSAPSGDLHTIDEPMIDFASIPLLVNNDGNSLNVSAISDRLLWIRVSRSISIPPFIRTIESCFRSIENCSLLLEIPPSIEQIDGLLQTKGLEFGKFGDGGRLRVVRGFSCCLTLRRVEFPASVESVHGVCQYPSLTAVLFQPESRCREITGFNDCILLPAITVPGSAVTVTGFNHRNLLRDISFDLTGALTTIFGFANCSALCEVTIPTSGEIFA
jgi:hypothetical protein